DPAAVVAQASAGAATRNLVRCFTRRRRHNFGGDSAGETPAVLADKMSVLPLQLRAERVSQPFHCSLPQRSTAELFESVLTALPKILRKGLLHLSAEIAIVHHYIQSFVNFSRTGVETGRPDHREQRVRHNGFDMDHCGLVFKNPDAAFEQLSVCSAAGGFG